MANKFIHYWVVQADDIDSACGDYGPQSYSWRKVTCPKCRAWKSEKIDEV